VKRKTPLFSKSLPPKVDMLGRKIKTQGAMSQLLFGARLKGTRDNILVDELNRLNAGSELPSIADIRYSSGRVKELQSELGQKRFNEAVRYFGEDFNERALNMVRSSWYANLDDKAKKKAWNSIRRLSLDIMITKYKKNVLGVSSPRITTPQPAGAPRQINLSRRRRRARR